MKKRRISLIISVFVIFLSFLTGCVNKYVLVEKEETPNGLSYSFNYDKEVDITYDNEKGLEITTDSNAGDGKDALDEDGRGANTDTYAEGRGGNEDGDEVPDTDIDTDTDGRGANDGSKTNSKDSDEKSESIREDGEYTSKDEVALYIYTYGKLPSNYITKDEAKDLGWESSEGNLNVVAKGKSIGGDKFGNREGILPKAKGRQYYECDIDYVKGKRNGKRIVYSNDGLIYYTEDHYNTYELLYDKNSVLD